MREAATISLGDFTKPGLIIPHLRGTDVPSVLQELAQLLQRENVIQDLLPFYQQALNREYMEGFDHEASIASPHARLASLKGLSFALGRSDEPLAWNSGASRSVRLVFLTAVPATDSTQYLQFNSGLARLTRNAALLEELISGQDTFQLWKVLRQLEVPKLHSTPL